MKLTTKDPAELRLHPLYRHLPDDPKDSPAWHSFVDGLSGAGADGIPPLVITADGRIMDGRRLWQGGKQLGWTTMHCVIQDEARAAVLMVESLMGQRSITRGAKVYLALGLMKEFIAAAEQRRLANLKQGIKTLENPLKVPMSSNLTSEETLTELSARFGITRETLYRAKKVRDLFDKHPDLRAEWEPALLSGEKNLWNVISAIEGKGADQSTREPAKEANQLELFGQSLVTLRTSSKFWSRFDEEKRAELIQKARETVATLPLELCEAMVEAAEERLNHQGTKNTK